MSHAGRHSASLVAITRESVMNHAGRRAMYESLCENWGTVYGERYVALLTGGPMPAIPKAKTGPKSKRRKAAGTAPTKRYANRRRKIAEAAWKVHAAILDMTGQGLPVTRTGVLVHAGIAKSWFDGVEASNGNSLAKRIKMLAARRIDRIQQRQRNADKSIR